VCQQVLVSWFAQSPPLLLAWFDWSLGGDPLAVLRSMLHLPNYIYPSWSIIRQAAQRKAQPVILPLRFF